MMTAKFSQFDSKKILIQSDNGKSATITNYGDIWQIKYDINGARANMPNYAAAITHLQKKGW